MYIGTLTSDLCYNNVNVSLQVMWLINGICVLLQLQNKGVGMGTYHQMESYAITHSSPAEKNCIVQFL